MYLVFTTSTGEAITVVQKPAPNAEVKWQGRSSLGGKSAINIFHSLKLKFAIIFLHSHLTSHQQ